MAHSHLGALIRGGAGSEAPPPQAPPQALAPGRVTPQLGWHGTESQGPRSLQNGAPMLALPAPPAQAEEHQLSVSTLQAVVAVVLEVEVQSQPIKTSSTRLTIIIGHSCQ